MVVHILPIKIKLIPTYDTIFLENMTFVKIPIFLLFGVEIQILNSMYIKLMVSVHVIKEPTNIE